MSVGLLYFELDLDTTKFVKKQNDLKEKIKQVAADTDLALQKSYDNLKVTADAVYKLQANLATASYERISKAANQSFAEQTRAAQAYIAEINKTYSQMANSQSFGALGIRSAEMIAVDKANMMRWYEQARVEAAGNAAELVRIEAAKNAKILTLNNELNAVQIVNEAKRVAAATAASEKAIAMARREAAERAALSQAKAADWSMLGGGRSTEAIRAEQAAVESAYLRQKQLAMGNSRDLIELENSKNAKMVALNMELHSARIATMNQEKIATANKVEAQIAMERAHSAALTENAQRTRSMGLMQIAAQKEDQERNWQTLGIRSTEEINKQIANVQKAATAQQGLVQKGSQDWINIERAKNEKLKELNKEMVGDHEMSMASMTRAVLRLYAAYYVLSSAVQVVGNLFMGGVKAIDDMKLSTVSIAAQITTMQGTTGDITKNYKENLKYAEALIPVLMKIDASSYANLSQIQKMNTAMSMQGYLLDANNKTQIEAFTALTNAVSMYTQGQDKEKQSMQEIRALFTGQVRAGNMLAIQMDQQIKRVGVYKEGLKGLLDYANKNNISPLELMKPYLTGIIESSSDIQKTWSAISTSMETSWNIIQRGLFADFYKSIIENGSKANEWMKKNAEDIVKSISDIASGLKYATEASLLFLGIAVSVPTLTAAYLALNAAIASGTVLLTLQVAALSALDFVIKGSLLASIKTLGGAMKTALGVFAAFFVGWEIGGWLNNFESIRKAGVHMVYGIMDAWNWLIKTMKLGWEYFKLGAEIIAQPLNAGALIKASQERMSILKGQYETEKSMRGRDYKDQLKSVTDVEIEYQKARKKFIADEMKTGVPDIPPPGATDNEAAKKAAEEYRKIQEKALQEEMALFDQREKENTKYLEDGIKDRASIEAKALQEELALFDQREKENSDYLEKMKTDAAKAAEDHIKELLRIAEEESKRPQREADEARKMVTFYQDMIGMEDEYRQAKLDWIEKEAAVKFAGMDKELLKERWMKDQKIKFEQEISDAKAKQIQQGLGDMASMFQSLSGMYDKNSGEYARLQEAANAMIVLQKAVAVVNAVSAVAASAAAPFPAGFVAMASMAAAMGSLLGSIGVGFSSGSSAPAIAYGQNTTVFGGANNQGSDSISKSWELLQDTYTMEDTKLTGIYNEMKNLNQNITGIVREIVSGGITGASFDVGSNNKIRDTFETIIKGTANLIELGTAGWLTFAAISPALALTPAGWAVAAAIVVDKVLGVGIVDKAIGWLSSGLFGGDITPRGSGISVQKGGTAVYPYQRWTESGGWFSGDKDRYAQGALNEELTNLFSGPNGVFTTLRAMMIGLAEKLDGDVAFASKSLEDLFGNFEINLAGLDAEGINKKIGEELSKISDNYAKAVFGDLIRIYQQVGEGAFETVQRLVVDLVSVTNILEKTGQTMTTIIPNAIALSESLIDIAGGLDKLQEAADAYYDKFFNEIEKQQRRQDILTESLSKMGFYLPSLRESYRDLVEIQDLNTESGKRNYVALLQLSSIADEYYSVLEDVGRAQKDATKALRDQSDQIDQWLREINLSTLAPSNSKEAIQVEYDRLKGLAASPNATSNDTSNFLNYAKEYLSYMRNYGGDYQDIYAGVIGDVQGLKTGIDLQIDIAGKQLQAIIDADAASRVNAAAVLAQLQAQEALDMAARDTTVDASAAKAVAVDAAEKAAVVNAFYYEPVWGSNGFPSARAAGGYADRPTIFGEAGGEWAVPTYEPQRKNFLKTAPKEFWDNLGLNGGSSNDRPIIIENRLFIDGREIGQVVTTEIPRNGNLAEAIRRAAN